MQACFQQTETVYVPAKKSIIPPNSTNLTLPIVEVNDTLPPKMVRDLVFKDGMNVLGNLVSYIMPAKVLSSIN